MGGKSPKAKKMVGDGADRKLQIVWAIARPLASNAFNREVST